MTIFHVRDWDNVYETAETRKRKFLHWTPLPNKFDGSKYTELVDCPTGVEHYAAWCAVLSIASRADQARRGYLLKGDGTPHTAVSLARMTRLPERVFLEAIPKLVALGWLEECDSLSAATPADDAATSALNRTV